MKQFDQTILDVIGNTPIIKLKNVTKGVESEIYVKLEYVNPGGSIKDRIGKYMVEKAIERGELKPGGTIVEGTSGNTGVGLAMYAAIHGYKAIFVLPDKQSIEKINNLRAFGAKVVVTPTNVEPDDPRSYYSVAKRIAETTPNSFYANQYNNLDNRDTHYTWTGPEIYEQTKGEFDVFMAGIGTGGTITGTGKYLKEKMPHLKVVGVDIEGSILTHYFYTREFRPDMARPYVLEGIGEDILPENYDWDVYDDMVMVGDKESFIMTRALLTKEGIYAGGSSGAAVVAAIKYAKQLKEPKRILVILPDSGNRYAGKIYNDDWMRDKGYFDNSFNVSVKEVLEVLNKNKKELITLPDTSSVGDVCDLMRNKDISQVPISRDGQIVGLVTENKLLRPLFESQISLRDPITVAMENNFAVVDENELLEKVANSLLSKKSVLITSNGNYVSILTDIDILNYMSHKAY